jgi:CheY-like chemotaxis protein
MIIDTTKEIRTKLESVLLIDDNEIDNFINRKVLENYGVKNILIYTSAIEALNYLKKTKDPPKIILLEIYLPIMSGLEFLDKFWELEIVRKRKTINIFILSSSVNPADIEIIREKCSGFIEKPFTIEKIFTQFTLTI